MSGLHSHQDQSLGQQARKEMLWKLRTSPDQRSALLRKTIEKDKRKLLESLQKDEVPFSEREIKGIGIIDEWFEARFKKLGIAEHYLDTVEHIVKVGRSVGVVNDDSAERTGLSMLGIIALSELRLPRDLETIATLLTYSHEREHNTGLSVFSFHERPGEKNTFRLENERLGLLMRGPDSALEEGAAMRRQINLYKVIRQHFPQEAQIWEVEVRRRLLPEIRHMSQKDQEQILEVSYALVTLYDNPSNEVEFPYRDSLALYNFLDSNIPSFERLVERARVLDEMLPLARAIESTFGKDSFVMTVSATEETAYRVQAELKRRLEKSKKK